MLIFSVGNGKKTFKQIFILVLYLVLSEYFMFSKLPYLWVRLGNSSWLPICCNSCMLCLPCLLREIRLARNETLLQLVATLLIIHLTLRSFEAYIVEIGLKYRFCTLQPLFKPSLIFLNFNLSTEITVIIRIGKKSLHYLFIIFLKK